MIRLQDYENFDNNVNKARGRLCAFKGTTGKLLLLEISKSLNCSSVGFLKCVHISVFLLVFEIIQGKSIKMIVVPEKADSIWFD